jgi:hypothetical protein
VYTTACAGQTGKRATEGAVTGAAAGAVGGVVSALIFGGDVGNAAARGAAWGASTGAVSGAIAGSKQDNAAKKKQQQAAAQKLKAEIGDDAFAGLTALAQCKHPVALGYAQTAQKLDNKDFALAGLWLEILTYADQGAAEKSQALIPAVIQSDPDISSESEAIQEMEEALIGLANIRREHNLAEKCAQ